GFILHSPAAPVSQLQPHEVLVEVGRGQLHARGHALQNGCQGRTVGLARRQKSQRHTGFPLFVGNDLPPCVRNERILVEKVIVSFNSRVRCTSTPWGSRWRSLITSARWCARPSCATNWVLRRRKWLHTWRSRDPPCPACSA